MQDTELIRRFLAHQGEFLGYVMAMTRSLDAAEEILQEVAVVMLERRKEGEVIQDFRAWTKEVVRRQTLVWLRRQIDRRRVLVGAELLESIADVMGEEDVSELDARHEIEALRRCMQKVPERSRVLLTMRYQQRSSFEDIATAVKTTSSAVQRSLSRLRLALRDCVAMRLKQSS
jgi:RNA polymerase sigma-70 factor (ECF subfamily)